MKRALTVLQILSVLGMIAGSYYVSHSDVYACHAVKPVTITGSLG